MGAPKELLVKMRDDAHVLALVAATDDVPFTNAIIDAVANWFDDVEIRYPIAEMDFTPSERRGIVNTVANEMLELFARAVNDATSGELDDEMFKTLAGAVDPLWRELAGAFAPELNRRFEENRVPAEHSEAFLNGIVDRMREDLGDEAVDEFRSALHADRNLRAHLRRMGLDPDALA
jgi:hypothetical protein